MILAPIILFVYKRVESVKSVITSLLRNNLASESEIYIFCDGPKGELDSAKVKEVQDYVDTINGFKKVNIFKDNQNKGLANSVILGVSKVFEFHDKVIVLEDDLIVRSNFLAFMNQCLESYEHQDQVFSISGYSYQLKEKEIISDAYFVTRGCSWGWATWKNRWIKVDWDINNYSNSKFNQKGYQFNYSGSDFPSLLKRQKYGKVDSWAIRWYYNQWREGSVTLYPKYSLLENIGFDLDATHTVGYNRYKVKFFSESKEYFSLPSEIQINSYYQKELQRKFSLINRAIFGRFFSIIKNSIPFIFKNN